jgi:hypothetical protein
MTNRPADFLDGFYGFADGFRICHVNSDGEDSRLGKILRQLQDLWLACSDRAFEVPEAASRCAVLEESSGGGETEIAGAAGDYEGIIGSIDMHRYGS